MRFGKTEEEIKMDDQARAEWHPWFAWYPVRLPDGRRAWLETIECRQTFGPMIVSIDYMMYDVECEGWYWEYRPQLVRT